MEHMGRSEAPLSRDYWEGIPGGVNRKSSRVVLSRSALYPGGRRHAGGLLTERLRGVDYKYNRQGSWWLASLAIAKAVTQFRLLSLEPDPQKHLTKIRPATVATDSEVK